MKTISLLLALAATAATGSTIDANRSADYDYDVPAPGSYALPVIKPAANATFLDSTGKPVRLTDLSQGRITVMSFIYTRCAAPKACPHATGVLMQLHRASAEDRDLAAKLALISMSFDPENDTPERMAAYSGLAANRPLAAPWHFVTTRSQAKLKPILEAYGQAVDRKTNPMDPTGPLNHTLRVFLIDAQGYIRNIYSSGTLDPRLVLADIRTLMMQQDRFAPLKPEQAGAKPGDILTVDFQVASAVRVHDITNPGTPAPREILLVDASLDGSRLSPVDRAGVLVSIPASALPRFSEESLDALARRYEGKRIAATGKAHSLPDKLRRDAEGRALARAHITVTGPEDIRILEQL